MIDTPVQAAAGASLRERAIAAAVARERRDREEAAERRAAIQRDTIKAATSTGIDIFGDLARGVSWLYVPATAGPPEDPDSVDRALATIGGESFEFEYRYLRPPLVLWHLVACPSLEHDAYMRSREPVASLTDLGELLRNPEGRYRCPECERAEAEGAEQAELHEVAEAPPSVDEALRRAGEAFRWAVETAAASEGAPAAAAARLTAFANLSQACTALAAAFLPDGDA